MKRIIDLFITERGGLHECEATPETTLVDVALAHSLEGYDFVIDNQPIAKANWGTTKVYDAREIWASKGVKGAF